MDQSFERPMSELMEKIERSGAELRQAIDKHPGLLIGAMVASGLLAGLVFRRERENRNSQLTTHPLAALAAAALVGYVIAPQILGDGIPSRASTPRAADTTSANDPMNPVNDLQEVS